MVPSPFNDHTQDPSLPQPSPSPRSSADAHTIGRACFTPSPTRKWSIIHITIIICLILLTYLTLFLPVSGPRRTIPQACLGVSLAASVFLWPLAQTAMCRRRAWHIAGRGLTPIPATVCCNNMLRKCPTPIAFCCFSWMCMRILLFIPFFILVWTTAVFLFTGLFKYPLYSYCSSKPPSALGSASSESSYVWVGAVNSTSASFRFANSLTYCYAIPAGQSAPQGCPGSSAVGVSNDSLTKYLTINSLTPCTKYSYLLQGGGGPVTGSFKTFPSNLASNCNEPFTLLFGSCAGTGSDSPIFDKMKSDSPDLFVHLGDLHYDNVKSTSRLDYVRSYLRVLDPRKYCRSKIGTGQPDFYRSTAVSYMWDDHDFLGNDVNGMNENGVQVAEAVIAQSVYQQFVPHYSLPLIGSPQPSLYQSFNYGNLVQLILTDLHSTSSPKRKLSDDQIDALISDIVNSTAKVIIWAWTQPWLYRAPGKLGDSVEFPALETRLARALTALKGSGRYLIMVSGDMHSQAFEDGRNTGINMLGFPLLQTAPFDRRAAGESCKGGPYLVTDFCDHRSRMYDCGRGRYLKLRVSPDQVEIEFKTEASECPSPKFAWRGQEQPFQNSPFVLKLDSQFWQPQLTPSQLADPARQKMLKRKESKWSVPSVELLRYPYFYLCIILSIILVLFCEMSLYGGMRFALKKVPVPATELVNKHSSCR